MSFVFCQSTKCRDATPADPPCSLRYHDPGLAWQRAAFLKPGPGDIPPRVAALAPLIVHRDPDPRPFPQIAPFPRTAEQTQRNITPVVFFAEDNITLHGHDRDQVSFVWFYLPRDWEQPVLRGIRMTLDSAGFPVIYEVFDHPPRASTTAPSTSCATIYVSKSLEQAASAEHGPPLSGRRQSSECALAVQPELLVPRIIEDGPQPMGPYVYVNDDMGVTTLHCRCSPSHVMDFSENSYYQLRPLSDLKESRSAGSYPASMAEITPSRPEMADPSWLEKALRLPRNLP